MPDLIDREAAIAAAQAIVDAVEIDPDWERATRKEYLGERTGARRVLDAIAALPTHGTCASCAEGHPMFGVVRCARLWGQYLARDGDEGCAVDPTLVDPDWYCAAWRAIP